MSRRSDRFLTSPLPVRGFLYDMEISEDRLGSYRALLLRDRAGGPYTEYNHKSGYHGVQTGNVPDDLNVVTQTPYVIVNKEGESEDIALPLKRYVGPTAKRKKLFEERRARANRSPNQTRLTSSSSRVTSSVGSQVSASSSSQTAATGGGSQTAGSVAIPVSGISAPVSGGSPTNVQAAASGNGNNGGNNPAIVPGASAVGSTSGGTGSQIGVAGANGGAGGAAAPPVFADLNGMVQYLSGAVKTIADATADLQGKFDLQMREISRKKSKESAKELSVDELARFTSLLYGSAVRPADAGSRAYMFYALQHADDLDSFLAAEGSRDRRISSAGAAVFKNAIASFLNDPQAATTLAHVGYSQELFFNAARFDFESYEDIFEDRFAALQRGQNTEVAAIRGERRSADTAGKWRQGVGIYITCIKVLLGTRASPRSSFLVQQAQSVQQLLDESGRDSEYISTELIGLINQADRLHRDYLSSILRDPRMYLVRGQLDIQQVVTAIENGLLTTHGSNAHTLFLRRRQEATTLEALEDRLLSRLGGNAPAVAAKEVKAEAKDPILFADTTGPLAGKKQILVTLRKKHWIEGKKHGICARFLVGGLDACVDASCEWVHGIVGADRAFDVARRCGYTRTESKNFAKKLRNFAVKHPDVRCMTSDGWSKCKECYA